MLRLIVKGNKLEATRAAANRAIPFVFVRELRPVHHLGAQTVGLTGVQHRDKVTRWFCESGDAPFPGGTLLLYTTEKDDGGPVPTAYPWFADGAMADEWEPADEPAACEPSLTPEEIREERSTQRGEALMQDPDIEEED